MPARKHPKEDQASQSERFLKAAEQAGATKSTAKFERVFRKVVPQKKQSK